MNDPTPDVALRRASGARVLRYALGGFVLGALVAAGVAVVVDDDPVIEVEAGPLDPAGSADDPTEDAEPAPLDEETSVEPILDDVAPDPPQEIGPPGEAAPDEPVRLLIVGDSVAAQIGWSMELWSQLHPGVVVVFNEAHIGCGVVREGEKRVADGSFGPVGDVCSDWGDPVPLQAVAATEVVSWPSAVELFQPDIVVATISGWDATDRIVPGVADDWVALGDPVFDAYAHDEYEAATDALTATGAHLYWLVSPYLNAPILHDDHRDRIDRLNQLVADATSALPEREVTFLDYPAFIGEPGSDRDVEIRDDGVHLSDVGFLEVAPWLVEQLGLE